MMSSMSEIIHSSLEHIINKIFQPCQSPHLPSFYSSSWWLLLKTVTWRYLYCMFRYTYSLLIEKDLCECRNVSVKFSCVYLCLLSGDFFILFGKSFLSFILIIINYKVWSVPSFRKLSPHLFCGLPIFLFPSGLKFKNLLGSLLSSIFCIYSLQFILYCVK